jgi:hypothetical protein
MYKIGSPANLEAELLQSTGATGSSEQQNGQQQQLFVQGQPQQNIPATNNYNADTANAAQINSTSARSNNVYSEENLFPIKSLNPYQNRYALNLRMSVQPPTGRMQNFNTLSVDGSSRHA